MEDFKLWFSTGFEHICNWQAWDHILFICLLCVTFEWNQWKKLLALITAFTIGHSATLALSALNYIKVPLSIIELLIPLSIMITALTNMLFLKRTNEPYTIHYLIVFFFGLIHGLGFSYSLKSMLSMEEEHLKPLFYFNLGIESGQLIIISIIVVISLFLTRFFQTNRIKLIGRVSLVAFLCAGFMFIEQVKQLMP